MSASDPATNDELRATRAASNSLLAGVRAAAIFLTSGILLVGMLIESPPLVSTRRHRLRAMAKWSWRWARATCRIAGIKIILRTPPPPPGCLITPNHQSYLDVFVQMALAPSFFVSRDDVEHWPVIGFFATQAGTIYHRRGRASRNLITTAQDVRERLEAGLAVCIYLEGTTVGGLSILPFKSSLVETAIQAGARVVPTAILWRTTKPGTTVLDDVACWRKDQVFGKHLWRFLGLRGVECEIYFGEPIPAAGEERKELTQRIEAAVRRLCDDKS